MNSFHHVAKYNSRSPSPRLANWFELPKGLPMLIAFTGFDIVRRMLGARTSAILMVAQKRDGRALMCVAGGPAIPPRASAAPR
jgi:hypothetical protein